jgi:hypothetical protein
MSIQNASSYIPIIITSTVLIITLAILAYYSLTSNLSSVLQSDLVYLIIFFVILPFLISIVYKKRASS